MLCSGGLAPGVGAGCPLGVCWGDGAPADEHEPLGGHVALAFKATKPWLAVLRRKWAPKKAYLLAALAYLRERPSRCSAMLLAALVTPVL